MRIRHLIAACVLLFAAYTGSAQSTGFDRLKLATNLEAMASSLTTKLAVDRTKIPVYDVVKDLHLNNNGVKLITKGLQHAIDSLTKNGPARFYFPRGAYLTGTIILRSNTHLELAERAKIIASVDTKDYPILYPEYKANTDLQVNKSVFYAEKVHDISLTGKGIIDFRGDDMVYLNTGNNDPRRPFGIRIISSENVYVAGLMLLNSPQWLQHYLNCGNVMIENVNVFNHAHENNDGMDIDGCRNVYVRNSRVDSDDDGICLKSNGPASCENVLVENCIVASHCNALKLGTETTGGFKNILYRNCQVVPSLTGRHHINGAETAHTAITLIITDGGRMENVWFDKITATNGAVSPIFVTLGNRSRKYTEAAPKPGIGTMENILLSNITATGGGPMPSSITGLDNQHQIKNITLENILLKEAFIGLPEDRNTDVVKVLRKVKNGYPSPNGWGNLSTSGLYFGYVEGITLRNINIETPRAEPREPFVIENSSHVSVDKILNNGMKYKIKK